MDLKSIFSAPDPNGAFFGYDQLQVLSDSKITIFMPIAPICLPNNEAVRQFALQGLKQVIYPDEAGDKLS